MIGLEEIFILMDNNGDNQLNFQELEMVANRFNQAILEFAKLDSKNSFLARSIFFYMVVNQNLPPGQLELLSFHAKLPLMNKAKIKIDRLGVAKIWSSFASPDEMPHPDCFERTYRP